MNILSGVVQGSEQWKRARHGKCCASDAPAMLGFSKYETRTALIRRYATGIQPEVDAATQARFDRGHAVEAAVRSVAEEMIGDELFPVTAVDDSGEYLASFDGITMCGGVIWENKLLNADLLAFITANQDLPDSHWPQVEHQLMVSGATKALFTVTDGTREGTTGAWYAPVPNRRAALIAGWKQFREDLATYEHRDTPAQAVGRAPDSLPALRIEIQGAVTASNLEQFRERALAVFRGISTTLETDEDFADAERTVKWCADIEERLDAAKSHALSQTSTIDELFRSIDAIREEARQKRLQLDKLVKARKEGIRAEIVQQATTALRAHVASLNARWGNSWMPPIDGRFADAIKGKRTIASLHDAVDTALAHAKIEANATADRIDTNRRALTGDAHDWLFLFPDFGQVANAEPMFFAAVLSERIRAHEEREAARRRQAEEQRALEEARKVDAERRAAEPASPVRAWAAPIEQADREVAAVTPIRQPNLVEEFVQSREWKSAAARKNAIALLEEFVQFTRDKRVAA